MKHGAKNRSNARKILNDLSVWYIILMSACIVSCDSHQSWCLASVWHHVVSYDVIVSDVTSCVSMTPCCIICCHSVRCDVSMTPCCIMWCHSIRCDFMFADCGHLHGAGYRQSGVHVLYMNHTTPFLVSHCHIPCPGFQPRDGRAGGWGGGGVSCHI